MIFEFFYNLQNKKSEHMLMRRAKTYCSSCFQVILVYFYSTSISSQFTVLQPKIAQKITKTLFWGSRSFKVIDVNSTKKLIATPVLVIISSISVPICNRFLRQRNQYRKNNHFLDKHPSLTPACASLLECRESRFRLLKLAFNVKNFIRRLYWSISSHFGTVYFWKCVSQPEIAKNSLKPLVLGVQGNSRSSMLTFLRSLSSVLAMIRSMSVPICNHFNAKWARAINIVFLEEVLSFSLSFKGTPLTQRHEILSRNATAPSYHTLKTEVSISLGLGSVPGPDSKTPRQNYRT